MVTPRNTVICPSLSEISQLSKADRPVVDLPPWLLMRNGCYPAAKVLVKVIEVKGNFIGVELPKAADKSQEWWMSKYPVDPSHHG